MAVRGYRPCNSRYYVLLGSTQPCNHEHLTSPYIFKEDRCSLTGIIRMAHLRLTFSALPFIRNLTGKGTASGGRDVGGQVYSGEHPEDGSVSTISPGDMVEVLTEEEVAATLDRRGRYRGLYFMPEMKAYCGGRFRVYKQVRRIVVEATGEVRRIKDPTFLLEGVFCHGEFHEHCDRACFLMWKDGWLRRLDDEG